MKIEDNAPGKGVDLYDIDYGECFMYDGDLYMRTPGEEAVGNELCVRMSDGMITPIPGFHKVEPVKAKVVIE